MKWLDKYGETPKAQRGKTIITDERQLGNTIKDNIQPYSLKRKDTVPLTKEQIAQRKAEEIKARQGEIRQHTPQSTMSKAKEIALNPMTAFGYVARNEQLPENFSKGNRVGLDYAIDVVNPVQYVEDTKNVVQGTVKGDLTQVGEGLLGVVPMGLEAKNIYKGINNLGNKYLPNTYKLNPFAKKAENFNNPNSFYRQIDDETFKEGLESGLIRGKQNVDKTSGESIINLNKSFGDDAYYKKSSLYSPQRADYIYEVQKGEEAFIPKVNNRTRGYTTENTPIRVSREPIPLTEANIYQKDWLQGYKKIEAPNTKFALGGNIQQPPKKKKIIIKDERLQSKIVKDNIETPVFNKKNIKPLTEAEKKEKAKQEIISKQGQITQHTPQSILSKTKEIALNPMTAFGYVARNEELPENFSKGKRASVDYAVDLINPAQYVEDTKNVVQGAYRGDLWQVGEGLLGVVPMGLEAKNIYKGIKNIPTGIAPELQEGLQTAGISDLYKINPWATKIDDAATKVVGEGKNSFIYDPSKPRYHRTYKANPNFLTGYKQIKKPNQLDFSPIIDTRTEEFKNKALQNFKTLTGGKGDDINLEQFVDYFKSKQERQHLKWEYQDFLTNINREKFYDTPEWKNVWHDSIDQVEDIFGKIEETLEQKSSPLGKRLGSGAEGSVYELAADPNKVIKIGNTFKTSSAEDLVKSFEGITDDNIARVLRAHQDNKHLIEIMPNLKANAKFSNFTKEQVLGKLEKDAKGLMDRGFYLDVDNIDGNFKYNPDKNKVDIYDISKPAAGQTSQNPEAVLRILKNHFSNDFRIPKTHPSYNPNMPSPEFKGGGNIKKAPQLYQFGGNKPSSESIDYDYVNYGTPEYEEAYKQGKFAHATNQLDEIVVTPYDKQYPHYQSLSPQQKKFINDDSPIGRQIRGIATDGVGFNAEKAEKFAMGWLRDLPLSSLQAPQSALVEGVEALRGKDYNFLNALEPDKQRIPSETWGIKNPYAAFAVDAITDPELLTGVGMATSLPRFGKKLGQEIVETNVPTLKDLKINQLSSITNDVPINNFEIQPWQMEELPGLHLQSTMENGAISRIIEPKTGLINTEQALAIIGKESGGADKVAIIKQGLGENIPKKIDYNDFRKIVQDQLIPLEHNISTSSKSNYGLGSLGYPSPSIKSYKQALSNTEKSINNAKKYLGQNNIKQLEHDFNPVYEVTDSNGYKQVFHTMDEAAAAQKQSIDVANQNIESMNTNYTKILEEMKLLPLENETLLLSNKYKFGKGSNAHNNPDETLGHLHFLRDAETPDVLTVTQIQSDAFQGSNHYLNKVKSKLENHRKLLDESLGDVESIKDFGAEDYERLIINPRKKWIGEGEKELAEAMGSNPIQKQLLDKNHQERYLQELVDYAGKRGDVNKVRVPTSETAANVQNYYKSDRVTLKNSDIDMSDMDMVGVQNFIEMRKKGLSKDEILREIDPDLPYEALSLEDKKLADILYNEPIENFNFINDYEDIHKTILKKYSEQPKLIKKLFGEEPKIVTDSKSNSWYEFNIPDKFKKGKGEIKAFSTLGAVGTAGANSQGNTETSPIKKNGGVIKDNRGQWSHPGEITEINSPDITMQGVSYPVLGVSKQTGEQKIMFPGKNYSFSKTKQVIEYPLIKWLDKY